MVWLWLGVAGVAVALWLVMRAPKPRILGVYSRPTLLYPLKFVLMKYVIGRRQRIARQNSNAAPAADLLDGQFGGSSRDIAAMERKQNLPAEHSRAGDCVFFDASNANGWWFTLGMAQRHNDVINLFCILKVPGLGTFVNEELPHTNNVKAVPSNSEYRTESGFCIRNIKPMQEWHLSFSGHLVPASACQIDTQRSGPDAMPDQSVKRVRASFELVWKNYGEYFDFDTECSPEIIGRSIALEPWSHELFQKLRDTHQTHYEQFGKLSGVFRLDYFQTPEKVEMMSMRDHTITKYRNWTDLRRYLMIIFHLEDGTCIHTSVISMPETVFTHLKFGYLITPELKKVPVDDISINLPTLGENKRFPKKFNYSFRAGGMTYQVTVESKDMVRFKMGLDEGCYVEENMCEFLVNGTRGHGFAECEYRIEPY